MPGNACGTIPNEPRDNKDSTFVSQQRIKSAKVGTYNSRLQHKLRGLKSQAMLDGKRPKSKGYANAV